MAEFMGNAKTGVLPSPWRRLATYVARSMNSVGLEQAAKKDWFVTLSEAKGLSKRLFSAIPGVVKILHGACAERSRSVQNDFLSGLLGEIASKSNSAELGGEGLARLQGGCHFRLRSAAFEHAGLRVRVKLDTHGVASSTMRTSSAVSP